MQNLKRLVSVLILLAITQLAIACSQVAIAREAVATDNWQPAALAAPPGLMEQVVKENIRGEWLGDPGRMSIIKLQEPGQQKLLYLINTRIIRECPPRGCDPLQDPLCGSAGCAYFGYVQSGKSYRQVFNEYLKSSLPPDVPFMRVSKQISSGLPCLEFAEMPKMNADSLQIKRFCYNGNIYKEKGKSKEPLQNN
ncbi:MAG: hypothetical protein KME05_14345 [Gloeocapsa sp. UFS-A4-WI-NPMV-4B04]|jgi:hypothetical protein|nr:hypothetical protein [Gloeocapsa sp. UFS-A4-WI-NPMV-4B04]